ncbi:MAG: thiol-disulfide oxidoreductase [Proteobacteria bacterium]|nr:thiol-disulfide oxidoreductase [Pseudomonadota bacterium]|tara:strand:- start:395 stop:760 length:366 start_codon:yes stop_codon:yes gene_type:complete
MIKVFYDGKCNLCAKEIDYYRRIAPAGFFYWQDITESAEELNKDGISTKEGLKFLHVKDNKGKLHVGVAAFVVIWSKLDMWRILARLVSFPLIRQIADWLYGVFAEWRFKRSEHCQVIDNK